MDDIRKHIQRIEQSLSVKTQQNERADFLFHEDKRNMRRVKPIDSWVLPVTINGIQTFALVDTGAGCNLLSKAIFDSMPASLYPIRQRQRDIQGIGQTTIPTLGDLICNVTIAGHHYPIDMVVSSEHEAIGCIIRNGLSPNTRV